MYESAKAFAEALKEKIGTFLPDTLGELDIVVNDVQKNNSVMLTGITIKERDINIAPVIYVDKFYEAYSEGNMEFDEACSKVAQMYMDHRQAENFEVEKIMEFDGVKDKIIPKLVATATNEEMLSRHPHTEVGPGLSAVYQINLSQTAEGTASVKITNQMADQYGVTADELHEIALGNLESLSRPKLQSMNEIMMEMMMPNLLEMTGGDREQAEIMFSQMAPENPMFVITNESKVNGAVVVLDDKFMDQVAEQMGSETIYILPSSIHEMICLPTAGMDPQDLNAMVAEVDANEVSPEERLSGFAYGYDAETHRLYKAEDAEFQQRAQEESESQSAKKGR